MKPKVAICGSAPSAAFAVMACKEMGIFPEVFSTDQPRISQAGAFFLHWVPDYLRLLFPEAQTEVTWQGIGTARNYVIKQWGRDFGSSFPEESRTEVMFDSCCLKEVWSHQVVNLVPRLLDTDLFRLAGEYDWVFHTFSSQAASLTRDLTMFPVLTYRSKEPERNYILYNGDLRDRWVRMTRCWERISIEFPRNQAEIIRAQDPVYAAMELNWLRDIHPEVPAVSGNEWLSPYIVPIGRFAEWNRKRLSHEAHQVVQALLQETSVTMQS